MKRQVLLFLFLLILCGAKSQIQELAIIPEDPITPNDNVSVIAYTVHANSDCPIVSSQITQFEDTIYVYVQHEMGLLTAICNAVDTTSLGTYAPGTYTLEYLFNSGTQGIPAIIDTMRIEFTVQNVNQTPLIESSDEFVQLFPNPGTDHLIIETEARGTFAVFDVNGRKLNQFQIRESPYRMDLEKLDAGLYFLLPVDNEEGRWAARFVVR